MTDVNLIAQLQRFDVDNIGLSKGALSFVLVVTRALRSMELPANIEDFKTAKQGQVKGLGGGAIRKILTEYGIERTLSSEGGRTSRGNMERLAAYLEFINSLHESGGLDLHEVEKFWIGQVEKYFDSLPFTFHLDPSKSLRFCVRQLLVQALARQREVKGTMYVGALMQHLVGAKLDKIVDGKVEHHGFAVADSPTNRSGDFVVGDVAFHVTTAPSDALVRKCIDNLKAGLRPVIVTSDRGLGGALALAAQFDIEDRIDVIEIEQFISTNLYEWSKFEPGTRGSAVEDLITRYNRIVGECESDPSFRVEFDQ